MVTSRRLVWELTGGALDLWVLRIVEEVLSCSLEGVARSRGFRALLAVVDWVERPRIGSAGCWGCWAWEEAVVADTVDLGIGRRDVGLGSALALLLLLPLLFPLPTAPIERFSSIFTAEPKSI